MWEFIEVDRVVKCAAIAAKEGGGGRERTACESELEIFVVRGTVFSSGSATGASSFPTRVSEAVVPMYPSSLGSSLQERF